MSATDFEQEVAQTNGVLIKTWAQPARDSCRRVDGVTGVTFERTRADEDGRPVGTGEFFRLEADMVFKAIGQRFDAERAGLRRCRDVRRSSVVALSWMTSGAPVWTACIAGGDCVPGVGPDRGRRAGRQDCRACYSQTIAGERVMADLSCKIAGVSSPNPFWLASAPPTDKQYNVERAFEAGWGGVVWKTLGEAGPPVVNVSLALRLYRLQRPAHDRLQQHRAHHRPAAGGQSQRDHGSQESLAGSCHGGLAHGAV